MASVVRVLPDVPAIDREFDYLLPERFGPAAVGTMVRVPLAGRRVAGWITAVEVEPDPTLRLSDVSKISGVGPDAAMIDLCRWAAWRWSGRLATFLRVASPPTMVASVPGLHLVADPPPDSPWSTLFDERRSVLRLPPADDVLPVVFAAAARGDALVICPSIAMVRDVVRRLRRARVPVASYPSDWARAAAGGCVVVGTRVAAFAPMPALGAVVVIDEHDEALQNEGSPTWHAREVSLERARRVRAPAAMTSPCPSLESVARSPLRTVSRAEERRGWPRLVIIDRRGDDLGRSGLYSERLVAALRSPGTALCVLNRTGRAGLLACRACGEVVRCERCDAAVSLPAKGMLRCQRCGTERPEVCQSCGSTALAVWRQGIARAREELAALLGEEVVEVSGATRLSELPDARVYVGTEAVLHQVDVAATVAFLEIDQELLAPRIRAAEQALALLARAARLVGGRVGEGRLVVQTRNPDHEVLRAVGGADPGIVMDAERERRQLTRMPPVTTTAVVAGEAAAEFVDRLGPTDGIEVHERDGSWLLVADDRRVLLDALAGVERPAGRLRLQVDPMRPSTGRISRSR